MKHKSWSSQSSLSHSITSDIVKEPSGISYTAVDGVGLGPNSLKCRSQYSSLPQELLHTVPLEGSSFRKLSEIYKRIHLETGEVYLNFRTISFYTIGTFVVFCLHFAMRHSNYSKKKNRFVYRFLNLSN